MSLPHLKATPFKGPVIIYVERGGREKRRGVKAISDWLEEGLNFFIKKFRGGGQQFDRQVYFKRGPLAKMGKAVIWKIEYKQCM